MSETTDARFGARVEAAAAWLMSDDSAYEHNREAAIRAASEMLRIGDEVEAEFELAYKRALAILDGSVENRGTLHGSST